LHSVRTVSRCSQVIVMEKKLQLQVKRRRRSTQAKEKLYLEATFIFMSFSQSIH